jgi:tetrahydromethanopterin S-methyltransferase subunit A
MNLDPAELKDDHDLWPPVRGEYVVGNPGAGVAVVTLASLLHIRGAAIVGPCKTENLGVEKIVANIISNVNIRFLLICGAESKGHLPGDTLKALHKNGVDDQGRITGSRGAIPFIQNLPTEAIARFQEQVELVDRIGLEDEGSIELLVREYNSIAQPFPKEPIAVVKKRRSCRQLDAGEGEIFLGSRVAMSASGWLVMEAGGE